MVDEKSKNPIFEDIFVIPSFRKILWPVFDQNSGQANERTDMGQSIGPASYVGGSKKQFNRNKKVIFDSLPTLFAHQNFTKISYFPEFPHEISKISLS